MNEHQQLESSENVTQKILHLAEWLGSIAKNYVRGHTGHDAMEIGRAFQEGLAAEAKLAGFGLPLQVRASSEELDFSPPPDFNLDSENVVMVTTTSDRLSVTRKNSRSAVHVTFRFDVQSRLVMDHWSDPDACKTIVLE